MGGPAPIGGERDDKALRRLSRFTRPCMRRKTPVLHGLAKFALRLTCPKGKVRHTHLIVHDVPGGRMALDLNASLEYSLFFRGCHEPEIGRQIRRLAPRGGTCLDVGANVGAHTLVMAQAVGPAGRVVALEPHPEIAARLRRNVALNELSQVTVLQAALWDRDGRTTLHGFARGAFQQGISSLVTHDGPGEVHDVETITAATLEQRCPLPRCDLIKIDAEGAEPAILAQLDGLIRRARPCLIFEHRRHSWAEQGHDLRAVLAHLRALRYALSCVSHDTTAPLGTPLGAPLGEQLPGDCELLCVPEERAGA